MVFHTKFLHNVSQPITTNLIIHADIVIVLKLVKRLESCNLLLKCRNSGTSPTTCVSLA